MSHIVKFKLYQTRSLRLEKIKEEIMKTYHIISSKGAAITGSKPPSECSRQLRFAFEDSPKQINQDTAPSPDLHWRVRQHIKASLSTPHGNSDQKPNSNCTEIANASKTQVTEKIIPIMVKNIKLQSSNP